MRSMHARPSSWGMRMSSRTTSGFVCPISGSTWLPSVAAPTTSMSSALSSARRTPSRVRRWSSASSTFIRRFLSLGPEDVLFGRLVGVGLGERAPFGEGHGDAGRAARRAVHVEGASEEERALAHADEAHAAALRGADERALELEAPPVIADLGP